MTVIPPPKLVTTFRINKLRNPYAHSTEEIAVRNKQLLDALALIGYTDVTLDSPVSGRPRIRINGYFIHSNWGETYLKLSDDTYKPDNLTQIFYDTDLSVAKYKPKIDAIINSLQAKKDWQKSDQENAKLNEEIVNSTLAEIKTDYVQQEWCRYNNAKFNANRHEITVCINGVDVTDKSEAILKLQVSRKSTGEVLIIKSNITLNDSLFQTNIDVFDTNTMQEAYGSEIDPIGLTTTDFLFAYEVRREANRQRIDELIDNLKSIHNIILYKLLPDGK